MWQASAVLFEALRPYRDIIRGVHIDRFRSIETAHELRARVFLRDGSVLHIRDYLFRDGTRKYAYHWQTATGRLRRRWDNSGHCRRFRVTHTTSTSGARKMSSPLRCATWRAPWLP